MSTAKRQKQSHPPRHEISHICLKNHVKPITNLEMKVTTSSGLGLFTPAHKGIASNSTIAKISTSFVMSVPRSATSPVGLAVSSIIPADGPSGEFVLWLDMAKGRLDPSHPNHPYLASLPEEMADVPSWSPIEREKLR